MSKGPSSALRRAAKGLAAASCLAILVVDMHMGSPGDPGWWALALVFLAWQAGPILLAAACAAGSRNLAGQISFLLFGAVLALSTAWAYRDILRSTSSTAAVGLFFFPLYQYAAWLIFTAIAALLGWSALDSRMKG
jgi:hypothetical protein